VKKAADDIFEPEKPIVPAGWDVVPFEKAAQVVSDRGKRIKQGSYLPSGKVPVIDQGQDYVGGYTDDETMAFEGELPVVLFGDHTRAIKYADKRFAVGAEGVKILRPADYYEPKFFYYLLRSLQIPSRGYSRHFQFLRKFYFPVAPKPQQQRIVAEIEKQFSRLDEAVANLKRVKANLKRYKAAVLKAAVEGKLTEQWRKQHPNVEPASELLKRILAERKAEWQGKGKYKEPEAPDISSLPELPRGWCWARLEELGFIVGGFTKNPQRTKLPRKLPYLRVANVYADELRLDEIEEIGIDEDELDKLLLHSGDLLIVEGNGSKDQIGRLAIWDGSINPCVHQNHIIKVRLVNVGLGKWILFWLLSQPGRHFVEQVASSTSGLYTLSVNKVASLPILLPPFGEQQFIVEEVERRLSVNDELTSELEANLTRAERLRQSILRRAFSDNLFATAGGSREANVTLSVA
jgi:type I restriction enzyme S subunit